VEPRSSRYGESCDVSVTTLHQQTNPLDTRRKRSVVRSRRGRGVGRLEREPRMTHLDSRLAAGSTLLGGVPVRQSPVPTGRRSRHV
jgi:hypothetical protein